MRHLPYIALLVFLASCTGRADRMRALLEQAEWMNRNDVLFTSDSIGKELVRYYDHWWHSPYLRLRAYYMLGSAYRDMGEAPAALHYYNIATEQVDTAHADSATYATLFRVYGQMAMIYRGQNLPREQLDALSAFSHYALLAKDTLSYIRGIEFMITPYYELDDTIKSLQYTEKAKSLFLKYGYIQNAAAAYPTAIYISLLNGNTARAQKYMDIFEHESGLFDEQGNIEKGREHYYYSKGLYYTKVGVLDSAEYFYRKLGKYGFHLEEYEGLLNVYHEKGIADTLVKYAALYKTMQEQWAATRQSDAILSSSAMYKYERNQNLAFQKVRQVNRLTLLLIIAILAVLLIFSLTLLLLYRNEKRKRKIVELKEEYLRTIESLRQTKEALNSLSQSKDQDEQKLTASYQRDIDELNTRIAELESLIFQKEDRKADTKLMGSPVVRKFQSARNSGMSNDYTITEEDWMLLRKTVEELYPTFYGILNGHKPLLPKEYRLCLLVKAHFGSSDIDILMGQKNSYSTNIKKRLNKKVFAVDGSAADFEQRILRI